MVGGDTLAFCSKRPFLCLVLVWVILGGASGVAVSGSSCWGDCFSLSLAGWLLMACVVGVVFSGYRSGRAVAG